MKKMQSFIKYLVAVGLGSLLIGMSVYAVQIPTSLGNALQYIMETVWTSDGTSSGTVNVDVSTGGIYIRTGFLANGNAWNNMSLGVDASGNVVYVPGGTSTPIFSLAGNFIPKLDASGTALELSVMYQNAGLIGVNMTNPSKSVDILGDFGVQTQGNNVTYQYNFINSNTGLGYPPVDINTAPRCSCDTTTGVDCTLPAFSSVNDQGFYCVDLTVLNNGTYYDHNVYVRQTIGIPSPVLITSGANVGVRTNNPQAALDVSGNVMIRSTPAGLNTWDVLTINPTTKEVSTRSAGSFVGTPGWSLVGNAGTNPSSNFLGTTDNNALMVKVNNQTIMRYYPYGAVVGGFANIGTALGAFIGGGSGNNALNYFATIGGGENNYVRWTANYGTVVGGHNNIVSGLDGFIGGGYYNYTLGTGATVVGGWFNTGSADYGFIGGGKSNQVAGLYSSVLGGINNIANGNRSVAVGQNAQALHDDSFVWNSTGTSFASTSGGQFLINAYGGVGLQTNTNLYTYSNVPVMGGLTVSGWVFSNYGMYSRGIYVYNFQNNGVADMLDTNGSMYFLAGTNTGLVIQGNGGGFFGASTVNVLLNPAAGGRGGPQANVGIGLYNPQYKLHVNGTVAGIGAYVNASDGRYKTNKAPITNALSKIMSLSGISYTWDREKYPDINFDNKTHLGFIAQDVEPIIPEAVSIGADGYYGMEYTAIIPVLVEAMKEQQTQITNLQAQVNALLQYNIDHP